MKPGSVSPQPVLHPYPVCRLHVSVLQGDVGKATGRGVDLGCVPRLTLSWVSLGRLLTFRSWGTLARHDLCEPRATYTQSPCSTVLNSHIAIKSSVFIDHDSKPFTNAQLPCSTVDHFYQRHYFVSVLGTFCLPLQTFSTLCLVLGGRPHGAASTSCACGFGEVWPMGSPSRKLEGGRKMGP